MNNQREYLYRTSIKEICAKIQRVKLLNLITLGLFSKLRTKKTEYLKLLNGYCLKEKELYKVYQKLQFARMKGLYVLNKKEKELLSSEFRWMVHLGYENYLRSFSSANLIEESTIKSYPYPERKLDIDQSEVNLDQKLIFPVFESPAVSIVIPCYNNFVLTMKCLRSVLKNTQNVSYEVIIADDNSTDKTADLLDFVSNIKHIKNKSGRGFVYNCNSGASIAEGRYLYFLNNDTQVQLGYLDKLVQTIESEPEIGIVGSMLIFPDGTVQEAGGEIFENIRGSNVGRGMKNTDDVRINYVRDTDYISGAALMIKTELFRELNGFDPVYAPAYCEDSDLCLRVWYHKKQRVVYQPLSRVVHFEGKSFPFEQKKALIEKNNTTLFNRFFEYLSSNHCSDAHPSFIFKDHACGKKQMLVVDWKILSPSFDTGSRVTLQYMKLFREMGMNVKFYPMDVYFERAEFLEDIQQSGIEVIFETLESYLVTNGKYFDYVFINRPDITQRYINLIRKYTKAQVIYQGHDLHYLRRYRENMITKPSQAEEIMKKEQKEEFEIISYTDLPCYVSQYEVDIVNKALPFSHCIAIPIFLCDVSKMTKVYKARERKDICFVAGFQHKPNIDGACWFVKKILPIVKKKIPDLKTYIIGSKPTEEVKALASDSVIVTGFVTDEQLDQYYSSVKVAIIPLNFGAGVKGKTVEAVYNKVPVLTTSVGAEGIDNSMGILSIEDSTEGFANRLIELYQNEDELQKLSDLSCDFIKSQFTKEAAIKIFNTYLRK